MGLTRAEFLSQDSYSLKAWTTADHEGGVKHLFLRTGVIIPARQRPRELEAWVQQHSFESPSVHEEQQIFYPQGLESQIYNG